MLLPKLSFVLIATEGTITPSALLNDSAHPKLPPEKMPHPRSVFANFFDFILPYTLLSSTLVFV
jgi:hypothetical protein